MVACLVWSLVGDQVIGNFVIPWKCGLWCEVGGLDNKLNFTQNSNYLNYLLFPNLSKL